MVQQFIINNAVVTVQTDSVSIMNDENIQIFWDLRNWHTKQRNVWDLCRNNKFTKNIKHCPAIYRYVVRSWQEKVNQLLELLVLKDKPTLAVTDSCQTCIPLLGMEHTNEILHTINDELWLKKEIGKTIIYNSNIKR